MAVYKVGADGKAQSGLKTGDQVVTGGGTYTITGVNADGTYKSTLTDASQTTSNYSGSYANGSTGSTGYTGSSGVKSATTSGLNNSNTVTNSGSTSGESSVSNPNAITDTSKYHTGSGIYYSTVGEKVDQASKNATWDANTDYSELLKKQIASGASVDEVYNTLSSRLAKAYSDESLSQYAWDNTTQDAIRYMVTKLGGSLYSIDADLAAQATLAARNGDYTLWNELGLGSLGSSSGTDYGTTTGTGSTGNTGSSTGTGSAYSGTSGYDDLSAFKAAMGYDTLSTAQQQAIDAYIQQIVNGLEAQKTTVDQSAVDAAQQAYISYMQSKQNLPQTQAASGYSGGVADSQAIGLEANLQNNQNSIELQRQAAVKEIEDAIINAQLEGVVQNATAQNELEQQAIAAYQTWLTQQQALENSNYWNQYAYDWQTEQAALDREAEAQSTAQSLAVNTAWTLLGQGIIPTDEILAAAGIDTASAQAYAALAAATTANGSTSSSSASSSGSGSSGYNNGSLTTSQVKAIQNYIGVTADGYWGSKSQSAAGGLTADEAWAAYQQAVAGIEDEQPSGVPAALYAALSAIEDSGNANTVPTRAANTIRSYLNQGLITESQAATLLAGYGFNV